MGFGWHLQMSVENARGWVNTCYPKYPLFDGLDKTQAIAYLKQLRQAGREWVPCGCKKTATNGKCMGWSE